MKATELYVSEVLFIMLCNFEGQVLHFDSAGEILKCDHPHEI